MVYDAAIRAMVCDLMNEGIDIKEAYQRAMKHDETRSVNFITQVTVSILTPECRACSAPGLQESLAVTNGPAKAPGGAAK